MQGNSPWTKMGTAYMPICFSTLIHPRLPTGLQASSLSRAIAKLVFLLCGSLSSIQDHWNCYISWKWWWNVGTFLKIMLTCIKWLGYLHKYEWWMSGGFRGFPFNSKANGVGLGSMDIDLKVRVNIIWKVVLGYLNFLFYWVDMIGCVKGFSDQSVVSGNCSFHILLWSEELLFIIWEHFAEFLGL